MPETREQSVMERRRFIRINANVVIKVEEMMGKITTSKAVSKNISLGGLLFEYYKPFPLSTVLSLELRIPEIGKRLECYAKVVRVEEIVSGTVYDIGVSFMSMDEIDLSELNRYIQIKIKSCGESKK